jgi:nitroreductase
MNLIDALRSRRSIRRYQPRPISKDLAASLIDAAQTAPSAGNLSARRYILVSNENMKRILAMAAYSQEHIESAPLLIVICADVAASSIRYGSRGSLYAIQDADAAAMCLLLAAHDAGLGGCWNGAFDDDLVREALTLEDGVLPVAILSLGWPAESPARPERPRRAGDVRWID